MCHSLTFLFQTYLVVYTSLNEVLRLGKRVCGVFDNQTINLCWFVIAVVEYYLVGPGCFRSVLALLEDRPSPVQTGLKFLLKHHEAISFFVYLGCLVYFVLTMSRTNYLKRLNETSFLRSSKLKLHFAPKAEEWLLAVC